MTLTADFAADWPALSQLLDDALALPPDQRAQWLAALPPQHLPLLPALRRVLQAEAGVETGFLSAPPSLPLPPNTGAPAGLPQDAGARAGDQIGPYRLQRALGAGGMGTVWLAHRVDGHFKRTVALKLPRLSWAPGLADRMARERDIVASLDHPNIARLVDAGFDAQGRPFLALEYVDGQPIGDHAHQRQLGVDGRLELLLQVAAAVLHAHSRLVIHRDLKPSNILVTGSGQVRLLDFGIAKLLDGEHAADTALTQAAGRVLTPDYASPEQIRGEPLGTVSDVYSLGVVAYELLAGVRPFGARPRGAAALQASITEDDPPLASHAAPDRKQARRLRGDIDAVLNKALKRSAADRYATADALAQDFAAALHGRPVQAKPDTPGYRARRFLGRNRAASAASLAVTAAFAMAIGIGATSLVIAALFTGLAAALWQAAHARRGRAAAEAASAAAERATARAEAAAAAEREATLAARREAARGGAIGDFMVRVFSSNSIDQLDPEAARRRTAFELLQQGVEQVDALQPVDPQAHAKLLQTFGDLTMGLRLYEQAAGLYARALERSRVAFGDDDVETHDARLRLAAYLIGSERGAEARDLVDHAALRLADLAPGSWPLARALSMQASVHAQRNPAKAMAAARAAINLMARLPPSETGVEEATAHQRLGRACLYGDDLLEAIAQHRTAIDQFTRHFGAAGLRVIEARAELAHALGAAGRYAAAAAEWTQLLHLLQAQPRPDAEAVFEAHVGLARTHRVLGEPVAAQAMLEAAQGLLQSDAGIRLALGNRLLLECERADLALAQGDLAATRRICAAALPQVPPDTIGLRLALAMNDARALWLAADFAAANAAVQALLPLAEARRGAGFMRLDCYALAAACAAALGDAEAAGRLLALGHAAVASATVAERRDFALALADTRVDALLGNGPALRAAAAAWLPRLADVPSGLPRLAQAELALLCCAAAPGHPQALEVADLTLAVLRSTQVPHSPWLVLGEAACVGTHRAGGAA